MALQVYFFSCIFIINVGMRLAYDKFGSFFKLEAIFTKAYLENKQLNAIFAIGALLLGFVLIIQTPDYPGYVPILGDIIPGLLSIVGGGVQLMRISNKSYSGKNNYVSKLQSFLNTNVAIIGALMIITGIIHAIFPDVTLL